MEAKSKPSPERPLSAWPSASPAAAEAALVTEASADRRERSHAGQGAPVARSVRAWLLAIWALVLLMVVVGGVTRLTGSGLSITEWRPVSGALPPLRETDWVEAFQKYQASPEFQRVNHWMSLADFKRIFFWEYLHRLIGRLIGVAVLLPFGIFLGRRLLPRWLALRVVALFALGGLQGLLGWYMVQSGLVNEPRVSHFRLAAHLVLAFATGQLALFTLLDSDVPARRSALTGGVARVVAGFLGVLGLQIVYGAFMAGTHAGYYFATFPDMNGEYAPGRFFTGASRAADALANPIAIHYLHRALGWLVLGWAVGLFAYVTMRVGDKPVRRASALVAGLALLQLNLGAATVLTRVSLGWAVAHQATAYLLLSGAVLLLHRTLAARPGFARDAQAAPATTQDTSRSSSSHTP